MSAFVLAERRPAPGRELRLDRDLTVGREGCDVVLADPAVSRRHAALRLAPTGAAVEDLGSSNGTYVNGERVAGLRELRPGDVVRIGPTEWELRVDAPPPAAPVPVPYGASGGRGDVPPPPAVTPSAVHRALGQQLAAAPPEFASSGRAPKPGSAATREGFTTFCLALVAFTVVALAIYFAAN